ncbi:hypothetical protein Tco_0369787 [Tanacetum coccineum]
MTTEVLSAAAESVYLSAALLPAPAELVQQSPHLSRSQSADPVPPGHQSAQICLRHEPSGSHHLALSLSSKTLGPISPMEITAATSASLTWITFFTSCPCPYSRLPKWVLKSSITDRGRGSPGVGKGKDWPSSTSVSRGYDL